MICVGMLPPRMPGMPPFAAYIFGQDPKLNLYFFPAAHTRNKFKPKKNTFFCSLLTWNSLKSLLTHTIFQEVEVWRGGEKPEAAFLLALGSLENHSCGKKTPPLHQWMNSRIYVTFYSSKTQCVCPTPPHTKVTMKKNEKNGNPPLLFVRSAAFAWSTCNHGALKFADLTSFSNFY